MTVITLKSKLLLIFFRRKISNTDIEIRSESKEDNFWQFIRFIYYYFLTNHIITSHASIIYSVLYLH